MSFIRRKFLKYMAGATIATPFVWKEAIAMFHPKLAPSALAKNVLIIGSGVTGLCLGAMLSRKGYKVRVLERNLEFIGGHARSFSIQGIEFCAGPQFLWEFGKGDIGYRVLEYLNLQQKVPMLSLTNQAQNFYQYGNESGMLLPPSIHRLKKSLMLLFTTETDELEQFFEYFDSLYAASKYLEKKGLYMEDYSDMRSGLMFTSEVSMGAKLDVWNLAKKTLKEVFDMCKLSERAQNYLYCQGGVFAENANDLSIGVYVAAMGHIFSNAYLPKHGFKHLIDSLSSVIKASGGDVCTNKEVKKAVTKDDAIVQLVAADGTVFESDYVISTLSPRLTCNLLDPCPTPKFNYAPSNSLSCLYVGVKNNAALVKKLKGRFIWWNAKGAKLNFATPDMLKAPVHLYAGSQRAITANQIANEDTLDLTIFAPGNFRQSRQEAQKGKTNYINFKESVTNQILEVVEEFLLPELRAHILFSHLKTPWDVYKELGAENGNVYGRRLNPDNVLSAVTPITSVSNLAIASATVGLPGIATCFNTASLFFEKITGEKI